jgi:hypothetical protein
VCVTAAREHDGKAGDLPGSRCVGSDSPIRSAVFKREVTMEQDRRDAFKRIGMLGASALALVGVSKRVKAEEDWREHENLLPGLWDMVIPVQPQVGVSVPLYFKYAISEGGFVLTGNYDIDATFNGGFTFSPGMGTYARTGPNTYRWRHETWVFDSQANPAGKTDNFGSLTIAGDGRTFSAKGTTIQYDVTGKELYKAADFTFTATKVFP